LLSGGGNCVRDDKEQGLALLAGFIGFPFFHAANDDVFGGGGAGAHFESGAEEGPCAAESDGGEAGGHGDVAHEEHEEFGLGAG